MIKVTLKTLSCTWYSAFLKFLDYTCSFAMTALLHGGEAAFSIVMCCSGKLIILCSMYVRTHVCHASATESDRVAHNIMIGKKKK